MAYIIDGNNVMGQTPGWHRDRDAARMRLLELTAEFARLKEARVAVVFDGAPESGLPDGSSFRGVRVYYAERGSDADTRIERLVESSKDRRGLTVVTSDRRLALAVRALGAAVMRSGEYRKLVDSVLETRPRAEKGEGANDPSINEWLRYFGVLPGDED
ncbi:MAG TPA: NYN domain-containing protein [Blastocatellia bacterium]|nr:NYN domain-containing protein [Blastocatellia bacterium]